MLYGVFLGTVVVASRSSWPVAWLGLELNLLSFISFSITQPHCKKGAMVYFVVQSCGSLLVLLGGIMGDL